MKMNKTWMWMLVITSGLLVAGASAKAASADKQLQKGIEAYQQNDPDQALDYFIDVLMNGDNEQVAQANRYIDAIHNKMGGIKQPVEVDVSFPDQPVQTVLTSTDTWARQNAQNVQNLSNQANQTAQNAINTMNAAPRSLTEQIEQRQLSNYSQPGVQPANATRSTVLESAVVVSNQANKQVNQAGQQLNQYGQQVNQAGQQVLQNGQQQVNQYGQQVNQYGQQVLQNGQQQVNQYGQQVNQYGQQINQYGQQAVGQVQSVAQPYVDDMHRLANDYELENPGFQSSVPASYQTIPTVNQPVVAQQTVYNAPAYTTAAAPVPTATGDQTGYITPNLSPAAYAERSLGGFTAADDYGTPASATVSSTATTYSASYQQPQVVTIPNTTIYANNTVALPVGADGSAFTDLTTPAAVEARNLYTAQKLQSMRDSAIAALTAEKGVHLYLRPDGRPDAIDIDNGVLFQGNSFRTEAFGTLNNIYDLLALTQGTRYIILPAGSYTDDVTLSGIRQAMALKSYLTKRGISQGKLYYNMGLVDQEVPTQFSNLKGLSIVFDYDANLPTRMLENAENETTPLLSMAIVPQCHAIDRSLGEAYAIDFSVLDTVNPINNWTLQVVEHGRNGNYYIVRQLEGFGPVYHQILWNGRKGIIGPELPCGKYTLVLTGVDTLGNKKVLRRRVVVKCAGADVMAACQSSACSKEKKSSAKVKGFSYKAARLWKKPGRVMYCASGCGSVKADSDEEEYIEDTAAAAATQTEETQTSSTSSSTYTKTETVRNVVMDDTSSQAGTVSSSIDTGYAPMPSNAGGYAPATNSGQYEASSYEEEYTTY